jgi:hypothetical protein
LLDEGTRAARGGGPRRPTRGELAHLPRRPSRRFGEATCARRGARARPALRAPELSHRREKLPRAATKVRRHGWSTAVRYARVVRRQMADLAPKREHSSASRASSKLRRNDNVNFTDWHLSPRPP